MAIATTLVLATNKPFVVEMDTSDFAIGAVLLQDGRPISFESKKFEKGQHNYVAYERELYAIIYVLDKWQHYLYGF